MTPQEQEHNYIEEEDAKLWFDFRHGDMVSYDKLIKKYSRPLFNFGYRFCQDQNILKDCIQELFMDLWNKKASLIQPGSIKWYLFTSIRNKVLREQTKWGKNESLDDDYDFVLDFSIEEKIIENIHDVEIAFKVKKVLETLPPRQREIIYLRFYEDLDLDQLTQVMGISKQSAHNLLQKAYKSIRVEWAFVLILLNLLKEVKR